MDQKSLVTEQIEAGRQFLSEFEKVVPVAVAFWMKTDNRVTWKLYVASEEFTEQNRHTFYENVGGISHALKSPYLGLFRVKLIRVDHPVARDILREAKRYAGRTPTQYEGSPLPGVTIEGIYVYPSPITVPVA